MTAIFGYNSVGKIMPGKQTKEESSDQVLT